LLAAQWTEAIRDIYKEKGSGEPVSKSVIKATGSKLASGVDEGFGEVDYDSPDYAMREYLKRNTWKFAVAKNYNDCVRLSNLLVRPDGSLRPWNEFKREALFVVGASNRYLKTEYDTAVAGAQMSRLWQEIQRDKHIFPFAQFDVVRDGRTSDICAPLDGVICTVDDPRLAYFFPPNHFNCRTTVRRLRRGVPTNTSAWEEIEIPEAFKNNTGKTGEVFTKENKYIAETPEEVLSKSEKYADRWSKYTELLNDDRYTDVQFGDNAGLKATHKDHRFDVVKGHYEKEVQNILFSDGHSIILESEKGFKKHVEGTLNNLSAEIKTLEGNNPNTIRKRVAQSVQKGAQTCILYFPKGLQLDFDDVLKDYFGEKPTEIIIISGNVVIQRKRLK